MFMKACLSFSSSPLIYSHSLPFKECTTNWILLKNRPILYIPYPKCSSISSSIHTSTLFFNRRAVSIRNQTPYGSRRQTCIGYETLSSNSNDFQISSKSMKKKSDVCSMTDKPFLDHPLFDSSKTIDLSVIIPTYNRLPILIKCLTALEQQEDICTERLFEYEVVVVDDGSNDGTFEYLNENSFDFPHVRLFEQNHGGATKARNLGVSVSRGKIIVFIDSDMVVIPRFLKSHVNSLKKAKERYGDDRAFTYGRVINTSNFETPQSEKYKITDYSAAFFATGNVAISKSKLMQSCRYLTEKSQGPFDDDFSEYGWEDLELGERLRKLGAEIEHCPEAVGFHYHPAFSLNQLPSLIQQEKQRGRGGVTFFQKHPNLNVRLMVQLTPFHYGLWFILTLGGNLNENSLRLILKALVRSGKPNFALGLLSPVLNWYTVTAAFEKFNTIPR